MPLPFLSGIIIAFSHFSAQFGWRMARKKTDTFLAGRRHRQAVGVLLLLVAALLLVSLLTHHQFDDRHITGEANPHLSLFEVEYRNQAGILGAYISFFLVLLVGWLAYFAPLGLMALSVRLISPQRAARLKFNVFIVFIMGLLGTMIYNVHLIAFPGLSGETGAIGGFVTEMLTAGTVKLAGEIGSYILLAGIELILVILYTSVTLIDPRRLRLPSSAVWRHGLQQLRDSIRRIRPLGWLRRRRSQRTSPDEAERHAASGETVPSTENVDASEGSARGRGEKDRRPADREKRKTVMVKPSEPLQIKSMDYRYPSLDLLRDNPRPGETVSTEEQLQTARMLKETLETFGVTIDGIIERLPGPVITRYQFKPGTGVKVNQIVNLSDDLALALKAKRIRIVAPIPGKAAVGVEIPNRHAETVYLKDILTSPAYANPELRLPVALGKTISGKPFVADLTRLPHLLIAGATGSGKSVCLNGLITSMLYRLHPMQVRFILIDPKMLELTVYKHIPHLGRPVVTNPRRAEKVLTDVVGEMESRYRRLAEASVRNIEDYNRKQKEAELQLPYIVICVDELADLLMAAASSKTELLITRLAQMARAVGIHLILATQRPSVDVITGLIKANFPARIAFQVSSKVDSRTIIDANGAEKLLGRGDMLFLQPGQPEPVRVHGACISSEETDVVVSFIQEQGLPMLQLEGISQAAGESGEAEVDFGDPLFREACDVVVRHKQGSVSLLQRRLGIGYQRAARLIDKLEEAGIVSPFDGSKARDVMVDRAYLETLFSGSKTGSPSESRQN